MRIKHIILIVLSLSVFALSACSSSAPAPLGEVMAEQDQTASTTQEAIQPTAQLAQAEAAVVEPNVPVLETESAQDNTEVAPLPEIDYANVEFIDCLICDIDLSGYTGDLSEGEIQGLLLALNDEYHAWAVYDQVLQDFGDVNPFANIIGAEAVHADALIALMNTYGVPVPENPWIGNAPSFDSTQEACAVGVDAEIENAALYDKINTSTDREDILAVYNSLQQASLQQHLPAFENCASGQQGGGQGQGAHGNGGGNRGQGNQG